MIKVNLFFMSAIIFIVCLVLASFLFYNLLKKKDSVYIKASDLCQCPICTYVFFMFAQGETLVCPRCKSFIDNMMEQAHAKTIKK